MPEVAIGVAQCIAAWSSVELVIGRIFVNLIGSNKEVGAALWNGLTSERAKTDAFRSLCASSLPMEDYRVVEAMFKMLKCYSATRHKMAHWSWGICDSISDGLIIIDPKDLIKSQGIVGDAMSRNKLIGLSMPGFSHNDVYLYRRRDLDLDFRDFNRTGWIVGQIGGLLAQQEGERAAQRDALTKDAHLAPFLFRSPLPDQ